MDTSLIEDHFKIKKYFFPGISTTLIKQERKQNSNKEIIHVIISKFWILLTRLLKKVTEFPIFFWQVKVLNTAIFKHDLLGDGEVKTEIISQTSPLYNNKKKYSFLTKCFLVMASNRFTIPKDLGNTEYIEVLSNGIWKKLKLNKQKKKKEAQRKVANWRKGFLWETSLES